MAANIMVYHLRRPRRRPQEQASPFNIIKPEEVPARLYSAELPDGSGYLYKYAGLNCDVQVAVSMGFRHYSQNLAVTNDPRVAAKLLAHADNITAARIVADTSMRRRNEN